jgi:branched-chain amino acid transport system substrate-binding protein
LSAKIYATPVFEDQSFIDQMGKTNADGIIYTYYGSFNLNSSDKTVTDFITSFKTRYQTDPSYYAALGYDNICIMIEALKNSNFDSYNVKSSLYSIQNFRGVTGEISFDKNGDVSKPVILKVVKNGEFSYYN